MDVQDEQDKGTKQIRPFGRQRPGIFTWMDRIEKIHTDPTIQKINVEFPGCSCGGRFQT